MGEVCVRIEWGAAGGARSVIGHFGGDQRVSCPQGVSKDGCGVVAKLMVWSNFVKWVMVDDIFGEGRVWFVEKVKGGWQVNESILSDAKALSRFDIDLEV